MAPHDEAQSAAQAAALSNAEIADRLAGLAQLLSTQKENPYKVKAYHRAAARICISTSRESHRMMPTLYHTAAKQRLQFVQCSAIHPWKVD